MMKAPLLMALCLSDIVVSHTSFPTAAAQTQEEDSLSESSSVSGSIHSNGPSQEQILCGSEKTLHETMTASSPDFSYTSGHYHL